MYHLITSYIYLKTDYVHHPRKYLHAPSQSIPFTQKPSPICLLTPYVNFAYSRELPVDGVMQY